MVVSAGGYSNYVSIGGEISTAEKSFSVGEVSFGQTGRLQLWWIVTDVRKLYWVRNEVIAEFFKEKKIKESILILLLL